MVAIKVQPGDMVVEGQVQPLTTLIFRATSVAHLDPGSGAFLTPGSGIRNRIFPDSLKFFENLLKFLSSAFQK